MNGGIFGNIEDLNCGRNDCSGHFFLKLLLMQFSNSTFEQTSAISVSMVAGLYILLPETRLWLPLNSAQKLVHIFVVVSCYAG